MKCIISCLWSIRPAYGGRDCPGSAFDYQMCNTEECAGPYEDFRAQQCIQRSNKYHKNIKHTWLPYEHPDGKSMKCKAKSWLHASEVSWKVSCKMWTDDICRSSCLHAYSEGGGSFLSTVSHHVCWCFCQTLKTLRDVCSRVFPEGRKCELSCKSKETGEVVFMNQVMHDGTRCSYTDPFSVCARGECLVRLYSDFVYLWNM